MKQLYTAFCLILTVTLPQSHKAQLSGTYTLDDTQASSATNFTSFTQLASALNSGGVSGPVTINVGATSGPYVEQVEFLQIAGTSAFNTITINGNGRTITYGAGTTALKATILMSGTDYVTINNLTVTATNASNAFAVHLWNGADNNTFNNCEFNSPITGTGTGLCPFSISGSSVTVASQGTSGTGNTVNTCTANGGYYGIVFYGSSSINNSDNKALNCLVTDFYSTGILTEYCHFSLIQDCVVERPTRLNATTSEGIEVGTGSTNCIVERNHIRKFFHGFTSTSTGYAIYCNADATLGNENIFRNNLISEFHSNGTQAGIYATSAEFAHILHNTIVLDDPNSPSGTTYGIFVTGPNNTILNNVIYITRAGTGIRNALDMTAAAEPGLVLNYNAFYVNAPSGTPNIADLGGTTYATLGAWQTATGYDLNSQYADPVFTNTVMNDYTPTALVLNNSGTPVAVTDDINQAARSPWAPDPGAFEMYTAMCTAAPPIAAISPSSAIICPNSTVMLELTSINTLTNSGYMVQWEASIISVGGYTSVPGATLNTFQTPPVNVTTYYQVVITCTNTTNSSATLPASVNVMPNVTDTVPYFESFETLVQNGLPNCNWSISSPGGATSVSQTPGGASQVPRTGNGYAVFTTASSGSEYFYTNPIQLHPNITYSASLFYITENFNNNNWADLSILVGTGQTPAGLVPITSISPVTGALYNNLSGTFSVNTSGLYYVAIKATPAAGSAPFLAWDDLSITIPCSLNSPTLSLLTSTTSICQNGNVQLTATGANTFSWSHGATGAQTSVSPSVTSVYTVTGTNDASGCASTLTTMIVVKPRPQVAVFTSDPSICVGETTTLTAAGADNFYWTSGATSATTAVSPAATTIYSVSGTNSVGCTGFATINIVVNVPIKPLTVVSATNVCAGDLVVFEAQGAVSYTWSSSQLFVETYQATVTPQASGYFTLTTIDGNGCKSVQNILLNVSECTSIAENGTNNTLRIFPNPTSGQFTLQGNNLSGIRITDIAGRVVLTKTPLSDHTSIDIRHLANGIYYVQCSGNKATEVIKIIKE